MADNTTTTLAAMTDVDNAAPRPALASKPKRIDAEARELIAKQMLRGRSKEPVLASLAELGHDPWLARGAIIRMVEGSPVSRRANRAGAYPRLIRDRA